MDRSLFRETGLTPPQADQLTLAEIAVLCEPDLKPGEVEGVSEAEAAEHLNRLAAMRPEERLWVDP